MNRVRSIVVGVDFTPCSAAALRQAIRIAKWNQAQLHPVHIIETLVATELEAALTKFQVDIQAGLVRDARKAWDQFVAGIPETADPEAADLDLYVEINHPTALMRLVRDYNADLLIMGTHGTSPADQDTGTLATACVRKAMSKVLLVRDEHAGPFGSVVACVDFSETSQIALQQAARVAVQDGATLHILHVFSAPWRRLHYRAPTPEATPDFEKQYRDGLRRRLEEFGESVSEELRYLKPQHHVFDFHKYGHGIIEFAKNVDADLVVLGTRGRSNLRDMLWGSTAERVVRNTPCSILAVKPPGFEHPAGMETEAPRPNPLDRL